MLLTKLEQVKYQAYVTKHMIEQQSSIIYSLDAEDANTFMQAMIKRNYKQAFEICTSYYVVHCEQQFMQNLLACFYPSVIRNWNKYFILAQEDDAQGLLFDKCLTNECKAFELIYQAIYS